MKIEQIESFQLLLCEHVKLNEMNALKKDSTITIRLSKADLERIRERANELGLTVTDLIINTVAK